MTQPAVAEFDAETQAIPADIADYCRNTSAYSMTRTFGYGVRSSAPGYMDCTDWCVYETLREAKKAYTQESRECRGLD